MKTRSAVRLIFTLAIVAALFSCTAQGGSIYATIETEQKINVSTLEQTLTILDIAKTLSPQFPYLVAAGAVYKGAPPDLNNEIGWPVPGSDPIAVLPPADGALCLALVNFGGAMYGAFFQDGPAMGLYKSVAGPNFSFRVSDGATSYTDPLVAGKQIVLLQVANGVLFAVIANPLSSGGFTYDLVSSDGTNFAATNLTGLANQITGVGFIGGSYFVTAGPMVYSDSGAGLNSLAAVTPFAVDSSDVLHGITMDTAGPGYLLIPSSSGTVYWSSNGTTWALVNTPDNVNGRQVALLTVSTRVGIPVTGDVFLVGSDGAGYYTLNVGARTLDRFSDVTVTGLYAGSVRKMLVDGTTVFMGTAGTGLWRAAFDPATGDLQPGSTWIHE